MSLDRHPTRPGYDGQAVFSRQDEPPTVRSVAANQLSEDCPTSPGVVWLPSRRRGQELTLEMAFIWRVEDGQLAESTRRNPRRANAAVASIVGLSTTQIRDAVHAAREKGFLTPTSPGRSGGEATERARDVVLAESGGPGGTS